ncbi:MAG: hypothetical protein KIB40_03645 [Pantoea sp.]|uniref:hypothetical protein n=1 Tax=Pantoea sp. TaxID=69393 RepID=UPI00257E98D7|nr:hypothetical protein [Pantoea sp.]MBS6032240.1 hypothetical protein [Pantoea sp.]
MTEEQKQALIDEVVIQALRDDVRQWQQRAEAAEAKLAELEKQEPVHFRPFGSDGETYVKCSPDHIDAMAFWQRPAPAADLAALVPDDTKRMDWLCAHCVEVRDPQMYGSHAMFHAQQDSEEWDLPFHTTLREQIDEAMRNIEEARQMTAAPEVE